MITISGIISSEILKKLPRYVKIPHVAGNESEYDMGIEYHLISLMDKVGMSQSELARKSGVSQSSINRYVLGDTDIPASKLVKIAEALDVTVDELLDTNQPTPEEEYIRQIYRRLTPEKKLLAKQLIEALDE